MTRNDIYLAYLNGDTTIELPIPISREDEYLYNLCINGWSGIITFASTTEVNNVLDNVLK